MKHGFQNLSKGMKTLMIHEIKKEFFELNLNDYELTFDDGLYSQYYYSSLINKYKTKKILFISPSLIQIKNYKRKQFNNEFKIFPTCYESMDLWESKRDNSNYMTLDELKEIIDSNDYEIGAHSYFHIRNYPKKMSDFIKVFKYDSDKMMEWFKKHLNMKPISYCFPYNIERDLMKIILKDYGFINFYGNSRLDIGTL